MKFSSNKIEAIIYVIREQRVMMDSDLAELYEVETKVLNQAVKRHADRFPMDFMFECNPDDLEDLRSQFVTANAPSTWNHKRRVSPMLFTENGVAMLSTVLNSQRAIQVNISIMRTFTKLRSFLAMSASNEKRVQHLEVGLRDTQQLFKIVFEKLDQLEVPKLPEYEHPSDRTRIGLKSKK